jgi:capsular exopolysaccharide synthesis family protein
MTMDLHQYLQAVRRFWPVVLVPTLLLGLYGAYSAAQEAPQYRASVTFFIATSGADTTSGAVQGDEFAQRRVNSYVAAVPTDRLATMVAAHEDIDLSPAQVKRMLGATGDLDTVLLTATVTSSSRALARQVAEVVATEFVILVGQLENSGARSSSVSLEVLSGPSVAAVPDRGKLTTALLAGLGFLGGLGLAVFLQMRDHAVRTEGDTRALDVGPLIGRIPFDRRIRSSPLLVEVDHQSRLAEAFRQLRTNLEFVDVENPVQVLVVTSSVSEEGKSVVASNLALTFALAGRSVLLVEADLRRPSVSDHFGIDRSRGLTDLLVGSATLDTVLHTSDGGLAVLPCGMLPPNPSELLGSAAMLGLLDTLRERFDLVVVDTPPLLPVADGAVAAAWADGTLLVARVGKVTRHQLAHARGALHAVNARFLGTVMTMVSTGRDHGYETYELKSPGGFGARALEGVARAMSSARPAGAPTPPRPVEREERTVRELSRAEIVNEVTSRAPGVSDRPQASDGPDRSGRPSRSRLPPPAGGATTTVPAHRGRSGSTERGVGSVPDPRSPHGAEPPLESGR